MRISWYRITFAGLLAAVFLHMAPVTAAQPAGEYVLGGRGTLIVTFDGAGNFSGVGAVPLFGVVNISGTAPVDASGGISGNFTLSDQRTNLVLYSSTLIGRATAGNAAVSLRLKTAPAQTFKGGLRNGSEPTPGGEYFATALPTSLIIQCNPSANRQVVTIQGDQDWGLDLTQAFAGQILFTQKRVGYGVVYENGDPINPPRWATAKYDPFKDKLTVTLFNRLFDARRKPIVFSGVSSGKYDGIYTLNIVAGDCPTLAVKVTIEGGAITGTDTNTGTITGTVDDLGNVAFTAQKLTLPAGCSQGGAHNGTITFNGTATTNPVFPTVLSGSFAGAGASGTFRIDQFPGVTGATTPGGVPRAENWSGSMTGEHESTLSPGGVFTESFTVSFTFPSSLIKALRGKSQIISGNGSFSGSETVKTQASFPNAISSLTASTDSGSVNVTFAGVENGPGRTIEFSSSAVLINNTVHFVSGPNAGLDLNENRRIIKLRVQQMTATEVKGVWADGHFFLKKQ